MGQRCLVLDVISVQLTQSLSGWINILTSKVLESSNVLNAALWAQRIWLSRLILKSQLLDALNVAHGCLSRRSVIHVR
jgi:hypothetical protein